MKQVLCAYRLEMFFLEDSVYSVVGFSVSNGILGTRYMCEGNGIKTAEFALDILVNRNNVLILDSEDAV